MIDEAVAQKARSIDVDRLPAIVVDGKVAERFKGQRITQGALRATGIGQTIP